ncbi:glycosyltransferase family 39 protein [Candidatus Sumerlaeota bacterium]|nr:glycosyltransferase family 39 protein [Candidatus Sumerlaeota bacterium]
MSFSQRFRALLWTLPFWPAAWAAVFYRVFDDDEFQHAHMAWQIWNGNIPYLDFFEHHLPLYHYLIAPLFIFGSHAWMIFALRGLSLAMLIVTLWLCGRLAVRLGASRDAAIAAVALCLFAPVFTFKALEVRPGALGVMLFVIALNMIFEAEEKPGTKRMLLAGFIAGAMTLASQKFGLCAVGCVAAAAILYGVRPAIWVALGGALSAAMFVLTMMEQGAWDGCWMYVMEMNLHWKHRFSPAGYLTELFLSSGMLLALGAIGVLRRYWDPAWNSESARRQWALLTLLLCQGLSVLVAPEPYRQLYMPLFPLLTIGAAWAFDGLGACLTDARTRRAALIALTVLAALPGSRRTIDEFSTPNAPDLARMRLIERLSPAGSPVFDGRGLMFYRPHVGFYGCMHAGIQAMLDPTEQSANVIGALRRRKLPPVILDYRVEQMPPEIPAFIAEHYLALPEDPQVRMPGFTLDRARLSGRRGGKFNVEFAGSYLVRWDGDSLVIDGEAVENGKVLQLNAGEHRIQARGFVENLVFTRAGG